MSSSPSEPITLIGGGTGVSEVMWQMQLTAASAYAGAPIYHYGTEIADRPVHQHCTAEGL